MRRAQVSVRAIRVLIVAPSLDILGGQAVQAQRLFKGRACVVAQDKTYEIEPRTLHQIADHGS